MACAKITEQMFVRREEYKENMIELYKKARKIHRKHKIPEILDAIHYVGTVACEQVERGKDIENNVGQWEIVMYWRGDEPWKNRAEKGGGYRDYDDCSQALEDVLDNLKEAERLHGYDVMEEVREGIYRFLGREPHAAPDFL